jgi:hypothetical protein
MSEPTYDSITNAIEGLIADGRPFVRCACGFVAVSGDEFENRIALQEHPCPHRSIVVEADGHWYDRIFSLWGFLILFVLAYAVLAALGKATW